MFKSLLISLVSLFFIAQTSFAQVTAVLVAPPYPNPEISEWENGNGDDISFTVNNFSGVDIDVKITGTIELNGQLIAFINIAKTPVKTLAPGVTVFTNPDVIPSEAIEYSSISPEQIYLSGKLPAGVYTYCVELVHPLDESSIIASSCVNFVISEQQLPILLLPANGDVFLPELANSKIFSWTPMAPPALAPQVLKYRLVMSEVMANQTPIQAIQGNTPILDEVIDGAITTYPWPASLVADTGTFVWTIQSIDPDNLNDQNEPTPYGNPSQMGYSSPFVFTVGDTSGNSDEDDLLDELTGDTLYAGLNGEFKILLDSNVTKNAGSFTGKGKVFIPMFRAWFEVAFTNIKVNSSMRLAEGIVAVPKYTSAPEYPIDWAFQVGNSMNWTHSVVNFVDNFIQNAASKLPFGVGDKIDTALVAQAYADASDNLLRVPQGINGADISSVENVNIALTEIAFKPNESSINVIMSMGVPASWEVLDGTNALGFRGKNFLFHPTNFEFSRGKVELVEDLKVNIPGDKFAIIFKKPLQAQGNNRIGTFYEWDKAGDSSFFAVDLDVEFSRTLMFPPSDPTGTSKIKASFNGTSKNWNDFLFYGNLPLAEIASTNGLKIEAQSMGVDFSEMRNVSDISFPDLYTGETSNLFKGFSLKQATLYLPEEIKTHSAGPINFALSKVIIDKTGFTFDLSAYNVYSYPNVDMAKLVASLDTVRISMVQNTVAYGMLTGKVTIPVSKAEESNSLIYKGVFNNGGAFSNTQQSYFNFNISPKNDIKAEVWKAKLVVDNTSEMNIDIGVGADKGKFGFDLSLDGSITIETDLGKIKDVKLAGVEFQNLGISYYKLTGSGGGTTAPGGTSTAPATGGKGNSPGGNPPGGGNTPPPPPNIWAGKQSGFKFNSGTWKFASPQKEVMGFEFSIGNGGNVNVGINIATRTPEQGEIYRGELLFTGIINLTENIGGGLTMGVVFAFRDDDGSSSDEEGSSGGTGGGGTITNPGKTTPSSTSAPSGGMSHYVQDLAYREDIEFINRTLITPPVTPIPPGGIGDYFRPKFIKARVDCVFVDVSTQAVDIKGFVKFRENDPIYGKGFKGKINANFKLVSIVVEAEAEFGKTAYQAQTAGQAYRYWRVEAGLGIPAPGIPMGPLPISIRGAGLGAYKNMATTAAGSGSNSESQAGSLYTSLQTPPANTNTLLSGLNFKPKESGWGFMGKLRCALTEESTLNFDVGLRAEFDGSSLQEIVLRGDFWAGAKIDKRNEAMITGLVTMGYNNPQRKFYLAAQVDINKQPFKGSIPFDLLIDGVGPNETQNQLIWRVSFGTFSNPGTVSVDLRNQDKTGNGDGGNLNASDTNNSSGAGKNGSGLAVNVHFYLMTGNAIEVVNGFTPQFINDYETALGDIAAGDGKKTTSLGQMAAQVSNNSADIQSGKGFAIGFGAKLGKPNPVFKKVLGDKVKFWYKFAAGGEFNLGLYDYTGYTCEGLSYNPIGMNGWRASGNFGFWATAGAGFQVSKIKILWKTYCENGCTKPLFDLGLGAWIYGELPRPTFVSGGIDGKVNVLGIFKVNFHAKFEFGEKCNLQNTNAIDEGFFEDLVFVENSYYDRRKGAMQQGPTDNIKINFANSISHAEYYITDPDGVDRLYEIAPSIENASYSFKNNNFNGMKAKQGDIPNSNIVISHCADHWLDLWKCNWTGPFWNGYKEYRLGVHRPQSNCTCKDVNDNKELTTEGSNNTLDFSYDVYIKKRPANGGSWSYLSFNNKNVKKSYSKFYPKSDLDD